MHRRVKESRMAAAVGSSAKSVRTRLAALVALTAMTFLLAGIAFIAFAYFGDIVVALLWLLVFACFGWLVLTTRGVVRLLAVPVALLGLVAVLLQLGLGGLLLLSLLFGVLTVFGTAARYAVRHDHATLHSVTRSSSCAPAARNGVLIINPKSGGGKAQRFNLVEEARNRNVETVLLEPGDDLRELATRAVVGGADVIGMAGGDGSQAIVATVAMQHDVAHVCIPAGTRNHFALDLGLDRDDVVGALDAFTDGVERRIDLARVNEHIFVNNASLGVYARVVQSKCYRDGKLRTWKRMLPEMLGRGAAPIDLQFETPGAKTWCHAALVVVSNNPYELTRFAGAGTRRCLDSGQLGIMAGRIKGAGSVAKLVTLSSIGQHRRFRGVLEWSLPEFEVRSRECVAVGLDGEALVLTPPLRFECLPGALRVRVSQHSAGVSPAGAAVSITRRDFARLVRIATNKPPKI
jgi:diacylglycerol kinase family enzyme